MKTRNAALTILANEPEKAPLSHGDILLSIRTPEGNLMTNRVRSLLREYGDRIQIPTSLVLEILENRNRKSRELRLAEKILDEADVFADEAVETMVELYNASSTLLEALFDATEADGLENVTEQIEGLNAALASADDFLAKYTEEEFDNGEDDDDDDDDFRYDKE
ncbi:MAG: hypothetical protein K6F57_00420 [Candidatus Saccharibacteria bacterium]|nr:hypothetical protein [Candidatus Saccharibacteria bacterium]